MVQWAYEIAGEIASDAVKAMALAMSLTKSFDASILEQIIALVMRQVSEGRLEAHEYLNALKTGELRHRLLRQGPVRIPRGITKSSAGPPAELLCFDGHMEISSIGQSDSRSDSNAQKNSPVFTGEWRSERDLNRGGLWKRQ